MSHNTLNSLYSWSTINEMSHNQFNFSVIRIKYTVIWINSSDKWTKVLLTRVILRITKSMVNCTNWVDDHNSYYTSIDFNSFYRISVDSCYSFLHFFNYCWHNVHNSCSLLVFCNHYISWVHSGYELNIDWYSGYKLDINWTHSGYKLDINWMHNDYKLSTNWVVDDHKLLTHSTHNAFCSTVFVLFSVVSFILLLLSVSVLTLYERTIVAVVQNRIGPLSVVHSLLLPVLDAIKLLLSDMLLSCCHSVTILCSLLWSLCVPTIISVFLTNICVIWTSVIVLLFSLVTIGCMVYGMIAVRWGRICRYSTLAGIRSIVTTIAYELTYSVGLLLVIIHSLSTGFGAQPDICVIVWLCLVVVLLVFRVLQECNRSPFDSVESHSEDSIISNHIWSNRSKDSVVFFCYIWSNRSKDSVMVYCVICYTFLLLFLYARLIVVCKYRAIVVRIRYDRAIQTNWVYFLSFPTINRVTLVSCAYNYSP